MGEGACMAMGGGLGGFCCRLWIETEGERERNGGGEDKCAGNEEGVGQHRRIAGGHAGTEEGLAGERGRAR